MKMMLTQLLLFLFMGSCTAQQDKITSSINDSTCVLDTSFSQAKSNYQTTRRNVHYIRKSLFEKYQRAKTEEEQERLLKTAQEVLTHVLLDSICPYWYHTPWSFDGHTETPLNGKIACGYFVSTTLLHAGFVLNRYKLAQQDPLTEARTIHLSQDVWTLRDHSVEQVQEYVVQHFTDGIYFVGLDNHVGYLLKKGSRSFFIHSNYMSREGVEMECIKDSYPFRSSVYYIAEITSNRELVLKWLRQEEVKLSV